MRHSLAEVLSGHDELYLRLQRTKHFFALYFQEEPEKWTERKIDNREPPVQTAQRELEDEAGIRAQAWFSLGTILSSPGVFDETIHLWLARTLTAVAQNTEPDEDLEVHWMPFDQALLWAQDGTIADAKSVAGLFRASRFA